MDKSLKIYIERLPKHAGKMEVLLAELRRLEPALSLDSCLLSSQGLAKRGYSKDILAAEPDKSNNSDYLLRLSLSREGLYDMLPEFLFHPPQITEGWQNVESMVAESKKLQEEELAARSFFLPFEQVFLQQRVEIEEMEQTYMTGFLSAPQKAIMDTFWPDIQSVADEYKTLMFYMLPLAHRISGHLTLMAQCFETLLLDKVNIEYHLPQQTGFDAALSPALGDSTLGVNAILGSDTYEEVPTATVHIGPVKLANIPDYIHGGKKAVLLPVLYDFFFPMEIEVTTDITLTPGDAGFCLDESVSTSRLGFSTVL